MQRTPTRAAVLRKPGTPLVIEDLFLDAPLTGEVLVRTLAVGLCHSDLHYITGDQPIELPAVLGHEAVGEIVGVTDPKLEHRLGQRVAISITPLCGRCANCAQGRATQCLNTSQMRQRVRPRLLDASGRQVETLGAIGAFAEHFIVGSNAAVELERGIPPVEASLLSCCISTGFGAVNHAARVSPLDSVAVIGCGGVGVAVIQAAKIAGARRIIALDLHQAKLDRARFFGATHTVLADDNALIQVQEVCPGGVDKSFEAVGNPTVAALAFNLLAPGGTATILGLERPGSRIEVDAALLIEGDRKLIGAYMGASQPPRDIPLFVEHRTAGNLNLDSMVTSRWRFEQINEGFEAMKDPDAIRAVLEFA